VVNGEVVLETAEQLRAALDEVIDGGADRLVVDLSGVEFIDSSGLAALIAAATRAQSFVSRRPSLAVRRLVRATGLSEVLGVTDEG